MVFEAWNGGFVCFSPSALDQLGAHGLPGTMRDWRPVELGRPGDPLTRRLTPDDVLAAARAEASALLSAAQHEAEGLRQQAQHLREEADEELRRLQGFIVQLRADLERGKQDVLARIEPELLALCAQMAGKVVRRVIASDADVVVDVVRDAIRRVADSRRVRVYVHPRDRERIESHRGDLRPLVAPGAIVEILDDEAIEPGGCVVRTDEAEVDADVGHQIGVLAERVRGATENADRKQAFAA
jgi:flagellar assembly protein FliH